MKERDYIKNSILIVFYAYIMSQSNKREREREIFFENKKKKEKDLLEEWRWTFSSTADSWTSTLVLFFCSASPFYDVAYDVYASFFQIFNFFQRNSKI